MRLGKLFSQKGKTKLSEGEAACCCRQFDHHAIKLLKESIEVMSMNMNSLFSSPFM